MADPAVLVTRPQEQASKLCQQMADAGFRPIHCPMMIIERLPGPDPAQQRLLAELDQFQHLIFVSANAVRCSMDWIAAAWTELPTSLKLYAVGRASADLLGEYGLQALFPEQDMSSDGLLRLPQLADVNGHRVLIARGEGGRTRLRDELSERGAQVQALVSYRRSPPELEAGALFGLINTNHCRAIMLSSGEGLDNMLSLLTGQEFRELVDTPVIVPGARVADLARESGFRQVIAADNAGDDSMLTALEGLRASWGEE